MPKDPGDDALHLAAGWYGREDERGFHITRRKRWAWYRRRRERTVNGPDFFPTKWSRSRSTVGAVRPAERSISGGENSIYLLAVTDQTA